MNRLTAILSASIFIFILSGCGSDGASGTDAAQPPPAKTAAQIRAEQYPEGMPAAHSKFAKVKIGMSNQEVMSLIGPPTSQSSHQTGKAWIPFFHGSDVYRFEYYYKNEGDLTFSPAHPGDSTLALMYVHVDSKASGYPPTD